MTNNFPQLLLQLRPPLLVGRIGELAGGVQVVQGGDGIQQRVDVFGGFDGGLRRSLS